MKKYIPLLLALCLLCTPMSAIADDLHENATASSMAETTNPDAVFLAGTVPAESEWTEAILLPVHALVLSMTEHELSYDVQSEYFVWNALYYALSLYGQADDRAQLTDEVLILPSESVQDFSYALFARSADLPPLPAELDHFIRYDALSNCYELALGDFALTHIQLDTPTPLADGTFAAKGTLTALDDGTLLCSFRIILAENDTMFGFSVLDVSLD